MDLDSKAKGITGYLNCRLFTQQLTGVDDIEKQQEVSIPLEGDILWWSDSSGKTYSHVAVYAGNNKVWQVEEWGGKPEKVLFSDVTSTYGEPDKIYSGKIRESNMKKLERLLSLVEGFELVNDKTDAEFDVGFQIEQEHKQTVENLIKSLNPNIDASELETLTNQTIGNIVKDHQKEFPNGNYYKGLTIMETELKAMDKGSQTIGAAGSGDTGI